MRVLIVGNAGEREPGRRFYSVERKLANGFARNGHNVWFFSDRDVARAGTILRSSRAGRSVANSRFLDAVRNFEPQAIVVSHASLITTETLAEAKRLPSRPRLAQTCVDPLFRRINVEFLADRAAVVDATFVTTAGPALKRFSTPSNVSAFIPNPVDPSIEDLRNHARDDFAFDVFFAANAGGDREGDARRATPKLFAASPDLICSFHGFDGAPGLYGADYFRRLAQCRLGLNINSDRAETATSQAPEEELYLYSSDRVGQLVGCGLTTLSYRVNSLMELFDDAKEMIFADSAEEMRDAALALKRDDARRRNIAEAGHAKAHAAFNERLVTRFIEQALVRKPISQDYAWPTTLW
jgi:hypothetical protein